VYRLLNRRIKTTSPVKGAHLHWTRSSLEIKGPGFHGMGSSLNTGSDWSRALIGTIQIAQPGTYTVTAQGDLPNAIEPQLLIGK
jgi:hypothetical protein